MSKLYGTLSGDGRAQEQTRCAQRWTRATAQSYAGSISVSIERTEDNTHWFEIKVAVGSTSDPSDETVMTGTLEGGKLKIASMSEPLLFRFLEDAGMRGVPQSPQSTIPESPQSPESPD